MSTRNQPLTSTETGLHGPATETVGPTCARCDHLLDYVDVEAVDRGRSARTLRRSERPARVIEHVRCEGCGAGGHRVRKTDTDAVVRTAGPAFPGFRGQIQNRIEMEGSLVADAPAPSASSWEEIVVDDAGATPEEASR